MSTPRVLHLIHHLHIGGAERLLVDLLPCLAKEGVDVHVACLDDRGPLFDMLAEQGIPGHCIGRRRGFDGVALWRLQRLLRHLHIEVLNVHGFSAGLWGRLAATAARTPRVVSTVHSVAGWQQPRKQYLCNRILQPATDRFIAVSESVRRSLVEQERTPPRAIEVIYNGIRRERFGRSTNPAESRERLGLPPKAILVGMIARCSREKGGDIWIRAMSQLARMGLATQGVLVGGGRERAAWQALAEAEGVAGLIRFAGPQADVAPWLAVLDVLVCPSTQESFGLVALEAQAAGVPVVATRVDGFLETLHDGEDAVLVEPDDPSALAQAIRSVLESSHRASRLVAAGQRNAARFTIERTAQAYAAVYRRLLADRRG